MSELFFFLQYGRIFPASNFFLIFVFLLLYITSGIAFCFLIRWATHPYSKKCCTMFLINKANVVEWWCTNTIIYCTYTMYLYEWSIIVLSDGCFFFVSFSVWFSSARIGLMAAFIVWFVAYLPYTFMAPNYESLSL